MPTIEIRLQSAKTGKELPPKCKNCTLEEVAVHMADDVATGIAQKTVGLSSLRRFSIILPPLALQQEFAAKVEAIEQMKAKVRQSLKESEELFNSRMDYYFN